jgi:hypothetical protein
MKAHTMKTEKQHTNAIIDMISEKYSLVFIPAENLANRFGFDIEEEGLAKFKRWTSRVGIRPAPMRPGFYDPKAVRERLDAFHQTTPANDNVPEPSPDALVDHVANRRLRNAQKGK